MAECFRLGDIVKAKVVRAAAFDLWTAKCLDTGLFQKELIVAVLRRCEELLPLDGGE